MSAQLSLKSYISKKIDMYDLHYKTNKPSKSLELIIREMNNLH